MILGDTLGFKNFNTAKRILSGIEIMNMTRKGQVDLIHRLALLEYNFINEVNKIKLKRTPLI